MGNVEEQEQSENRLMDVNDIPAAGLSPAQSRSATALRSQARGGTSAAYGAEGGSHADKAEAPVSSYIYALGRVEARFPSIAVEKEYYQVRARLSKETTSRKIDEQLLHTVLKDNRYLVRQMCWVLTIERVDHYILLPRDPRDLD